MDPVNRQKVTIFWTNGIIFGTISYTNTSIAGAWNQFASQQHNPVRKIWGYEIVNW